MSRIRCINQLDRCSRLPSVTCYSSLLTDAKGLRKVFLLAIIICAVGCIDNPMLPDFIRLPFEGSGLPTQQIAENQAEIEGSRDYIELEVEGRCDSYPTGAAWITAYENVVSPFAITKGVGNGIDGDAGTDSRPCLRYSVQKFYLVEFVEAVESAAAETGMWRVFISEVLDSGELRRVSSWEE